MDRESRMFARKSHMMTADAYIGRASAWSKALVKSTGLPVKADPYSAVSRMIRAETCADVPPSKIFALVRKPSSLKSICGSIHDALAATYAAYCARQKRLLEHEITIANAIGADRATVDAAEALVRKLGREAAQ